VLLVENDTLAFQRDTDDEILIAVARRGTETRPAGPIPVTQAAILDGVEFDELFTHQQVRVENGFFQLPAVPPGAQVWIGRNMK
jgi:hypothetical protein